MKLKKKSWYGALVRPDEEEEQWHRNFCTFLVSLVNGLLKILIVIVALLAVIVAPFFIWGTYLMGYLTTIFIPLFITAIYVIAAVGFSFSTDTGQIIMAAFRAWWDKMCPIDIEWED